MAPALFALGRRWHGATDDFAWPAFWGWLLHTPFLCVCAAGLHGMQALSSPECEASLQHHRIYIAGTLSVDGLQLLLLTWLLRETLQGSVLDAHMRLRVPSAVNAVVSVYALLLGMTIYGTHLYYGSQHDPLCVQVPLISRYGASTLMLVTIYSHWTILALFALIVAAGYNPWQDHTDVKSWEGRCACLSMLLCCRTNRRAKRSTTRGAYLGDRASRAGWFSSVSVANAFGRFRGARRVTQDGAQLEEQLSQLHNSTQLSPLATLAAVFSYFYSHVDLTISDVATGLLLVSILQKFDRQEAREKHHDDEHHDDHISLSFKSDMATGSQTWSSATSPRHLSQGLLSGVDRHDDMSMAQLSQPAGALHAAPVTGRIEDSACLSEAGGPVRQHVARLAYGGGSCSGASHMDGKQLQAYHGPPGKDVLQESNRLFQYAMSSYGWPMYVFMNLRRGEAKCLRICTSCCACCCSGLAHHPDIKQGDKQLSKALSMQSYQELTGNDPESSLLTIAVENEVEGLLPYVVAVCPQRKQLIIAVRGSMSQHDVVTDLVCEPAQLPLKWLQGKSDLCTSIQHLQQSILEKQLQDLKQGQHFQHAAKKSPDANTTNILLPPLTQTIEKEASADFIQDMASDCTQGNAATQQPHMHSEVHTGMSVESSGMAAVMQGPRGPGDAVTSTGNAPVHQQLMGSVVQAAEAADEPIKDLEDVSHFVHRGMLACAEAILEDMQSRGAVSAVLGSDVQGLSKLSPAQRSLLQQLGTGPAALHAPACHSKQPQGASPSKPSSSMLTRVKSSLQRFVGGEQQQHVVDASATTLHTMKGTQQGSRSPYKAPISATPKTLESMNSNTAGPVHEDHMAQAIEFQDDDEQASQQKQATASSHVHQREWQVIVVGHSLGAGVASLLGLHLRAALPRQDVRVWCFSPPGGLMCSRLSRSMQEYCTSVVIATDMIPRLSFSCTDKLNRDILMASALCKVPKAIFWLKVLWGKKWSREELFRSRSEVPREVWALVKKYAAGMASAQTAPRFQAAYDFRVPGKVLYYERLRTDHPRAIRSLDVFHSQTSYDGKASGSARTASVDVVKGTHVVIDMQANASMRAVPGGEGGIHAKDMHTEGGGDPVGVVSTSHDVVDAHLGPVQEPSTGVTRPDGLPAWYNNMFSFKPDRLLKTRLDIFKRYGAAGKGKVYVPRWSDAEEINKTGLIVGKRMFAFHVPDYQAEVLQEVAQGLNGTSM